jgi:glycosyltransferase involved in cell wall biosynthesis
MPDVKAICVCGQTPPPVHGQAVMIQALLDGRYSRLRLLPVRMAFSSRLEEVGKPGLGKGFHLLGLAGRLAAARLHGATVLYYPPAGPDRVPMWRDIILLLLIRPLFQKTIYHFHIAGLAGQYKQLSRCGRLLFRLAYGRPHLAIYLSASSPEDAAPLHPRASRVIPNGIADAPWPHPLDRSRRDPGRPPVILFAGALTAEKGLQTLIETLRLLHARGVPFLAVLAGEWRSPRYGEEVRRTLDALGLSASVRFAGLLSGEAKWQAFAEADIFFFPSEKDNFPLVLLEALMMELPVLTSDWMGMREIVEDGRNGFLAPRGDAPAFANKLERLLKDPLLRKHLGEAGRARYLAEYTIDVWRRRMEQALADCAEMK